MKKKPGKQRYNLHMLWKAGFSSKFWKIYKRTPVRACDSPEKNLHHIHFADFILHIHFAHTSISALLELVFRDFQVNLSMVFITEGFSVVL